MPVFSLTAETTMLSAITVATASLHTAYSTTGANEVIGGSPAYVRLPVVFTTPLLGLSSLSTTYTFDVPATTVGWIGLWDAGTSFLGMAPNGGDLLRPFVIDDAVAAIARCAGHAFLTGDTLVVWGNSFGPLPNGLAEGTTYYVVNASLNTLQLSATPGGAAIALSTAGNGYLQRIVPVTYASQDHFVFRSFTLDATVVS